VTCSEVETTTKTGWYVGARCWSRIRRGPLQVRQRQLWSPHRI